VEESALLGESRKSRQLQHMQKTIWQLPGPARCSNDSAEAVGVDLCFTLSPLASPSDLRPDAKSLMRASNSLQIFDILTNLL
jgi:hypothetical protein